MTELDGRLPAILDSVAGGVTVLDRSGIVRFANDAAARLLGRRGADELIGRSGAELAGEFELLDDQGKPMRPADTPTQRAMAGEKSAEAVIHFRSRGAPRDRFATVRARLLAGEGREDDLVVTAFQDVTSLKRSEARLRFVSEASAILAESVDYAGTLHRVADICVPQLADWCVVDVLEDSVGMHRVAVAHVDQEKLALAEEMRDRWPPDPDSGLMRRMLETRRPVHIVDMDSEMLASAARDSEHLAVLREIGIRSVLVVPINARGEVIGALSLVQAESDRQFTRDDIQLCRGARAAGRGSDRRCTPAVGGEGDRPQPR